MIYVSTAIGQEQRVRRRSLLSAIGDAQAVISAIGFNGGADSKGYEAIDNKARLFSVHAEC